MIKRVFLIVLKTDLKVFWPFSLALNIFYLHFNPIWAYIRVNSRFPEVLSYSLLLSQHILYILNLGRYGQKSEPWLALCKKSDVSIKENTWKKPNESLRPRSQLCVILILGSMCLPQSVSSQPSLNTARENARSTSNLWSLDAEQECCNPEVLWNDLILVFTPFQKKCLKSSGEAKVEDVISFYYDTELLCLGCAISNSSTNLL